MRRHGCAFTTCFPGRFSRRDHGAHGPREHARAGLFPYGPLNHSAWNGWTITDTVFPSFLWIVGVAIALSRRKGMGTVLRRALIIYLLGLVVYAAPYFSLATQRWLGVLQRIAICYLIASVIYLTTRWQMQVVWIAGLLLSLLAHHDAGARAGVMAYGRLWPWVTTSPTMWTTWCWARTIMPAHQRLGSRGHYQHLACHRHNVVRRFGRAHSEIAARPLRADHVALPGR